MPRIFIDTTTVRPDGSGTARYAEELSVELHNRSSLVVADDTWSPIRSVPETLPPHHALNVEWIGNRTNIQADAAIFPNYFMPFGWPFPSAVTIHDVSFISHPHFYSRRMRMFYKYRIMHTLKRAEVILTVSEASKKEIIRHLNVKPERILVHPPAMPLRPANPIPQAEQPYLLYVGNLEPKKNILNLIQGFNQLGSEPGCRLILAGKLHGPERWNRKVKNRIAASPNIIWDGYVTNARLNDYMSYASGLILVSHVEGFGLPVMDALSMNVPVLTSKDPALIEVAGEYGISANATEPESIATGIERLLHEPALSESGRSITERYGPKAYKEGISEIVDRLVKPDTYFFPSDLAKRSPQENNGKAIISAILGSVAYASVFKSGIHKDKLLHALSHPVNNRAEFESALAETLKNNPDKLQLRDTTVYTSASSSLANRKKNGKAIFSEISEVRKSHRKVIKTLLALPFIKGLYYSGGTVHGSGLDDKPDLDLLIITRKNSAWIAYACTRIISRVLGKSQSVCANYIIDESRQQVNWQKDYYTAFQLLFLKKVALKPRVAHIRTENSWIADFFPNHPSAEPPKPAKQSESFSFLSVLNLVIMFIWTRLWRMNGFKSGSGGLLWDAHRIKLHTNDHRPKVSGLFRKITHRLLSGPEVSDSQIKIKKGSKKYSREKSQP